MSKKQNSKYENLGEISAKALAVSENSVPPVYLREYVKKAVFKGPMIMLADGKWCGHKQPLWNIFSLTGFDNLVFFIRLSEKDQPAISDYFVIPRVDAAHIDNPDRWLTLYDARFHPGSPFAYNKVSRRYITKMNDPFICPRCKQMRFRIALGFEIPSHCINPNDMSWFALAVECDSCGWKDIIFQDEIIRA